MRIIELIIVITIRIAIAQNPTIKLQNGLLISGEKVYTESRQVVHAYRGIPYASPPVGDLRFAPPEKHPGWNQTLFAHTTPPSCPQIQDSAHIDTQVQDEDCLYLNIWTPEIAANYRQTPVVVFLEGEGFVTGSANRFPAQDLSAQGIIVVSVNYRLNVFGFFCLEDITARGNLGLLDQYLALLWVNSNIEAFGGNPLSITLMGHSSGAASVVYHMVSPRTAGLFHRAIIMSGSALSPWSYSQHPANSSKGIARSLGCLYPSSVAILQCLRTKSVQEILRAFQTQYKNGNWTDLMLPVVDKFLPGPDQYLPKSPDQVLSHMKGYTAVPVLTGITNQEGAVIVYQWGDLVNQGYQHLRTFFESSAIPNAMQQYGFTRGLRDEIREIIRWQYVETAQEGNSADLLNSLVNFYSDTHFNVPHTKQIKYLVQSSEPVFTYHFEHEGPDLYGSTLELKGAAHGSELLYLFGPSLMMSVAGRKFTQIEEYLSRAMKKYWKTFIEQGNIVGVYSYGPQWQKATPSDFNSFYLGGNMQQYPASIPSSMVASRNHVISLWSELLPRLSEMNDTNKVYGNNSATSSPQQNSDSSQSFRNATYTLIGFVTILLILLVICIVFLKKQTKERERDLF